MFLTTEGFWFVVRVNIFISIVFGNFLVHSFVFDGVIAAMSLTDLTEEELEFMVRFSFRVLRFVVFSFFTFFRFYILRFSGGRAGALMHQTCTQAEDEMITIIPFMHLPKLTFIRVWSPIWDLHEYNAMHKYS